MARTFITKSDIGRMADAGQRTLIIGPDCTITDVAVEYARARGVQIQRGAATVAAAAVPVAAVPAAAAPSASDPSASAPSAPAPAVDTDAVRAAVAAKLGSSPADLDAVIAKVLGDLP